MNTRGNLLVLSAPSGTGKSSLVRRLVARDPRVVFSVSVTTRAPREGEVDGSDYRFVGREEFRRLVDAGALLEHAEVHGNCYGTPRDATEERLAEGRDVLLEIDVQGAAKVRSERGAHLIFILPPSRSELERRLRHRGLDADAVIERRLTNAATEIRSAGLFDFVLVNDDFEQTLDRLCSVVDALRSSGSAMRGRVDEVAETFGVALPPDPRR